jgi:hypothetical protein
MEEAGNRASVEATVKRRENSISSCNLENFYNKNGN